MQQEIFKYISNLELWSRTIGTILVENIIKNNYVILFYLDLWFRRKCSYLELWWPFRKLEQDQLFNYAREPMRNNSVKFCDTELVVLLCLPGVS